MTEIRVGQVRETPNGTPYVVLSPGRRDQTWWVKGRSGTATWRSCTIHDDPVVGWSREHLPPPVLTANPAEVVEGEVRYCRRQRWPFEYTVRSVDRVGWTAVVGGRQGWFQRWSLPLIQSDRLLSRPGVTL